MNQPAREPSFVGALVGDGRALIVLTALALAASGMFAWFLSATGSFLPHDVDFLGMLPQQLCGLNQCRIVHFMFHDRVAFGGVLCSLAVLYVWLALFPLCNGESWAWWSLLATAIAGFASFLSYLSYGYLDHWHGWATLALLPINAGGLWLTRRLCVSPARLPMLAPAWRPARWLSAEGWGRLLLLGTAGGMIGAGIVISIVGMTRVFVPQDLEFLGLNVEQMNAINPRLIPLIAHDRAGFGGGLLTTGMLVLAVVWKGKPARHLWEALLIAGLCGFGCAIGIHYPIGYMNFVHLAPAWLGGITFLAGMALSYRRYHFSPLNGGA
jgi:hypothetical protein